MIRALNHRFKAVTSQVWSFSKFRLRKTLRLRCTERTRKKCFRLSWWSRIFKTEVRSRKSLQFQSRLGSSHPRSPVESPHRCFMSYWKMNHVIQASILKERTLSIPRKIWFQKKKLSQGRGKEERSSSAHTLTRSTTPRTCATTATTERERPRWLMPVAIPIGLTTLVACARTAILPSTTWKGRTSRKRRPKPNLSLRQLSPQLRLPALVSSRPVRLTSVPRGPLRKVTSWFPQPRSKKLSEHDDEMFLYLKVSSSYDTDTLSL